MFMQKNRSTAILRKSIETLLEGFMSAILSGVRVGVITWPADVRGTMTTVQLPVLVFPSFLSLLSVCLMNSLSSGEHAVPSTAMLCLSARSVLSQRNNEERKKYTPKNLSFLYIFYTLDFQLKS